MPSISGRDSALLGALTCLGPMAEDVTAPPVDEPPECWSPSAKRPPSLAGDREPVEANSLTTQ